MLVIATAFAAAAIGIRPGPTAWLAFVPMVLIVQVLPISIGGLGLREGALVFFLSPYGVSDGEAVLLGLVLYLLNLIASLAGAPSFAVGNRVPAEPEVLV
jgi:glycosyltransferase 2 family protein